MKNADWKKINEIFVTAIELDETAQNEFLRSACAGDENMRLEIEAILAASRQADEKSFLKQDAFRVGAQILTNSENGNLLAGKRIGNYKIIREIGRGGMGAVFLAQREDFKQTVALKLIKRGMDTDEIIERFRREREVLAGLSNPHIARLLDGGTTDDGLPYFVMEYVIGLPITQFCDEEKLNIEERLRLFQKLCSAVAYIHQNRIVHRDIKPSNILVDKNGEPKLLDFGIAKLLTPDRSEQTLTLTSGENRLFTPEYASPEQILGDKIKPTSDIYSLGVVLYELLCGHRPFHLRNCSAGEVLQIITEHEPNAPSTALLTIEEIKADLATEKVISPETIADSRRECPRGLYRKLFGDLDNITLKALRKDPARRYDSVEQFSEDIRRYLSGLTVSARPDTFLYRAVKFVHRNRTPAAFATVALLAVFITVNAVSFYFFRVISPETSNTETTSVAASSVAVLPLKNLSSKTDDEYLSVGLTDALITKLSNVRQLAVRPLSAVMSFNTSQITSQEAGKKLKVGWVLEGTIQRDNEHIHISVQLVRVSDNQVLWTGTFNEAFRDLLKFQDVFAANIADKLSLSLSGEDRERLGRLTTTDTEAFRFYLRGRHVWNKRTAEGLRESINYFRQAIDRDPTFALAYVGLADAYALSSEYNIAPPADTFPRAKAATKRALEIEPNLAEAHTTLAYILASYDWNFVEAEREYKRAIELNPNYATAHQWYAELLLALTRFDEAIAEIKQAQELDPLSPIIQTVVGVIYYQSRNYKAAIPQFEKTIRENPHFPSVHWYLALTYDQLEKFDEAAAEELELLRLTGGKAKDIAMLNEIYRKQGWKVFLQELLANRNAETQKSYLHAFTQAFIYTRLENREKSLEWLERCYNERIRFVIYIKADPNFDFLRDDPRFQDLIRRVGLQE